MRRKKNYYKPYAGRRHSLWKRVVLAALALGLALFCALEIVIAVHARDEIHGRPEAMVILGCQVMPWGPSVLLQDRLDTALAYLEEHPDLTVVVSGGQGPDEPVSEALCMRDYLVDHGVDAGQILMEDDSHNTAQNIQFSRELLAEQGHDPQGDVILVTNNFHLARAKMLWGDEGNLSTLSAPSSHKPSYLKMLIREPLALVKSFLFD